ncbi:hypothetical protein [Algihabitans albus]|uniref:hypothetical protein n=1 Tax=Algihabitans albus TaxID=2164067 RepID=UPI000E5C8CE3|nr:hypothetical protein [Algihabitans albus]
MKKTALGSLLAASLGGLLAACAPGGAIGPGGVVINQQYVGSSYDPSDLGFAQSRGGVLLQLGGQPFAGDRTEFAEQVGTLFEGSHFGPPVDFIVAPPEDFRSSYRVVTVFDAPGATSAPQLCRSGEPPAVEANGADGLRIMAAYCVGSDRVTSAVANVGPVTGVDDPAFTATIRALGLALFPPAGANDELRRSGDSRPGG